MLPPARAAKRGAAAQALASEEALLDRAAAAGERVAWNHAEFAVCSFRPQTTPFPLFTHPHTPHVSRIIVG
jgi:hypothetical protein